MMKSGVVCGSETWPMTEMDIKMQKTMDRKILRRIFRPVAEKNNNQELPWLHKDSDTAADIQRLDWN